MSYVQQSYLDPLCEEVRPLVLQNLCGQGSDSLFLTSTNCVMACPSYYNDQLIVFLMTLIVRVHESCERTLITYR